MPKKKTPPRSREEQERIFKEAAKRSGADTSGKAFEAAIKKIVIASKTGTKNPPNKR